MDVRNLVDRMTLDEKASLCSGEDFWHTKAIERLNIPSMMVSDGPHGLRKQDMELAQPQINESIKAVCFPTACATAASFDRELIYEMGQAIGEECQKEDVGVVLGPAVNIKRSPLCGRNFEYFSEDPYLATEMATSHIKGVQSKNVGTSIKHYLGNNQEHRRMTSSSQIDARTLREIYLAAFEGAIKTSKPWTVMCSYNKVNGEQVSESKRFLNDILRDEWGYDGFVVSDWGAVRDRTIGLKAGLELEMPSSGGVNDRRIVQAVKDGVLEEEILNKACERILTIVFRYFENRMPNTEWNKEEHHKLSRRIAGESVVLLKNNGVLPLHEKQRVAMIGLFAKSPRYQGGGSSHINSFRVESVMDAVQEKLGECMGKITYSQGYEVTEDIVNQVLIDEAVDAAEKAEVAVVFAGLPDDFESEGYDRTHMSLPNCQNALIEAVSKVQSNIVVVLHNGSPVEMPWIDSTAGIIEAYLGGQAIGGAVVDVLYGEVNPSGKLAETFPLRMEDTPSYLFYGGEKDITEYREGIFVGYRYYDKKKMEVLFPFGYGLSYTTFSYANFNLDKERMKDTEELAVSVDVTNIGNRFGKEVVQLYIEDKVSTPIRPIRELKEFAKVALYPGETKKITFLIGKRAFAYYNVQINDWHVESGEFIVQLGQSSRNIVCHKTVMVESTVKLQIIYDDNSTIGDILADPKAAEVIRPMLELYNSNNFMGACEEPGQEKGTAKAAISDEMTKAMLGYMPLRQVLSFAPGLYSYEELLEIIDILNEQS